MSEESPPPDSEQSIHSSRERHLPNHNRLEIDLTYRCNLKCLNCDRSCTQALSDQDIELSDIDKMLAETRRQGRKWESVHLLGGEPTLHPKFFEIIEKLESFFDAYDPSTELKVISNGYGEDVKARLAKLDPKWIHTKSQKTDRVQPHFEPFNLAPKDDPKFDNADFSKGCWITSECGVALTPQGYFPCAVSGGIERIIQENKGRASLPQSSDPMADALHTYCQWCGHFRWPTFRPRGDRDPVEGAPMSPSWLDAYRKYHKKRRGRENVEEKDVLS